jgi:hypothetical protein
MVFLKTASRQDAANTNLFFKNQCIPAPSQCSPQKKFQSGTKIVGFSQRM